MIKSDFSFVNHKLREPTRDKACHTWYNVICKVRLQIIETAQMGCARFELAIRLHGSALQRHRVYRFTSSPLFKRDSSLAKVLLSLFFSLYRLFRYYPPHFFSQSIASYIQRILKYIIAVENIFYIQIQIEPLAQFTKSRQHPTKCLRTRKPKYFTQSLITYTINLLSQCRVLGTICKEKYSNKWIYLCNAHRWQRIK